MTNFESRLEDYLDELEDLAWNRECSYKINRARNKISDLVKENCVCWKKLEAMELMEEERKEFKDEGYTFMWEGETPEIGETVLVTDGNGIYMREWVEFAIGVGFEDIDPPCWWMPLPKLLKENGDEIH